jgi:transcriptional regulator with XRE-family HTH domain
MKAKIDAEKLKSYRRQRDLTQEELAKMADSTRITISKLENGYEGISFATVSNIARALRVELNDLLVSK